jgi:uncharacterized phiE125 gp8 family phage protein
MSASVSDFPHAVNTAAGLLPEVLTGNTDGDAIDLEDTDGPYFAIQMIGEVDPDTTVTGQIKQSADGTSWSSITGGAFTAVSESEDVQVIRFTPTLRYVRHVALGRCRRADRAAEEDVLKLSHQAHPLQRVGFPHFWRSNMLVALSDLKAQLLISGSSDDTVLNQLIAAADSFIAQHTGRDFAGGTFTEYHAAGGSRAFLRNFPVTAITSLKVDPNRAFGSDTVLDTSRYVLIADRGVIESIDGPFLPHRSARGSDDWPGALKVVYTTATSAIPSGVTEAFNQLVSHWYRQIKTNADTAFRDVLELTSGGDTKGYPWNLTTGLGIPAGVRKLLDVFRVPSL